ncbi:SCO family protein [Sphingomonas xanthus]|uniref:SCO family protein n=1 Tax=Sphingomonas xanthus TaxID=2594473 RepID=A0A516IT46_9SPHN|nr:SCO family protein [Sphingomonas xanthus]QDP20004.1 SCO family protein [Sphingomonas xanthus]
MAKLRIVLWALVGLAALAGIYLSLKPPQPLPASQETVMTSIGGPFTLVDGHGQPFSSAKLNGKPAAIFFGFTHCPDVCPTTLARLARLRQQLGKGDDAFRIVFISVDPERDKPEDVGKYSQLFSTPVIGLTGSPAQVEQVKKQFNVYSEKVPAGGGGYSVDHTATIFLMDGNGGFESTISPEEGEAVALQKLQRLTV